MGDRSKDLLLAVSSINDTGIPEGDGHILHSEHESLSSRSVAFEIAVKDQEEAWWMERLQLEIELEVSKARVSELLEEKIRREGITSEIQDSIFFVRESLRKIGEHIGNDCFEERSDGESHGELFDLLLEMGSLYDLGRRLKARFLEYEERRRKEKKELENSILSLTEENRDMSSLLRVAVVEKEAMERSLNRLKLGMEQKKGMIMQIAERGLQRIGLGTFGFTMGAITEEAQLDSVVKTGDGNESEGETANLASTASNMIKNLRLEISNLKQSLEECRMFNAQLHHVVDEQAQQIMGSLLRVTSLEQREYTLAMHVKDLKIHMREAEEEVFRWKEACELEVDAGKAAIEERDWKIMLLREELGRAKIDLDALNNKVKSKEKLAVTAMVAQAATEASLQLAESRLAGHREIIEELTRQVEEEDNRGRRAEKSHRQRKVRHICWPWRLLRLTPTTATAAISRDVRTSKRITA